MKSFWHNIVARSSLQLSRSFWKWLQWDPHVVTTVGPLMWWLQWWDPEMVVFWHSRTPKWWFSGIFGKKPRLCAKWNARNDQKCPIFDTFLARNDRFDTFLTILTLSDRFCQNNAFSPWKSVIFAGNGTKCHLPRLPLRVSTTGCRSRLFQQCGQNGENGRKVAKMIDF